MLAVEFGSGRRGDFNMTSDRDILILGSDWREISAEAAKRSLEGYSVSSFMFSRASHLTRTGNLFFKHIYDEGVLVSGEQEGFRRMASEWRVARDYRDEARQNMDLLEVLNFIPKTRSGVLAATDILASSSRNILIRRLAQKSIFVFSWSKILQEASRHRMIKSEDIPALLLARDIKNIYRQGRSPRVTDRYFRMLSVAASRACGVNIRPRFANSVEMRSLPERYQDGTYKQLRAFELMCAQYPFDAALAPMMQLVNAPAYFCANGPNHSLQARRP